MVVKARHTVTKSTLSLIKRTAPSPMPTFTPPGCRLRAALCAKPELAFVQGGFHGYVLAFQYGEMSVPLLGVLRVMYWVQGRSSFSMSPRMS